MYFVCLFILFVLPSWAYQASLNSSGNELFWANPSIPVSIQTNTSDMTSALARDIIVLSMNEWNQSGEAKVNLVSASNNEIKFVPNYPYGSAVIGVTEVSYNTSGAIQKASILLNDDFYFHSSPGLYPAGEVFLGDVVTHELGHLFGLSHSEVINSSMFYSSFSGQSSVASDDKSGIRSKYDSSFGNITGHVKGGNSIGVLGVHVQAISRNTGESISAISDENGFFKIGGLDLDDSYYIYTGPVKNPDSLPQYFSNVQDKFCPGKYVGSFFSPCGREFDGKPASISLREEAPSVDVGTVSINCGLRSDEQYASRKLQAAFSPLTILDFGLDGRTEKAFVGWFRKTTANTWSTSDTFKIDLTDYSSLSSQKYLKVALVSYPLGTLLEYEMSVKQNGSLVSTASRALSYSSLTETYNTDFSSYLPLHPSGTQNVFEVSIRAKRLSTTYAAQTFPSFSQFTSDEHLPYLVVASLYENTQDGLRPVFDSEAILSDNDSCLDAPFTFAVKKTESAGESFSSAEDQTIPTAGCGTIEPPQDGPGTSVPLMTVGFVLSLLASSLVKTRKKFLS
jgi:Matrixin